MRERWNDYAERDLLTPAYPQLVEYQSMPPKRSFNVKVRYRIQGRAEPLDYPIDD